jgi:hypothetical protein
MNDDNYNEWSDCGSERNDTELIKDFIPVKGQHKLRITKQNGGKKNVSLFTTRCTPGSKIRCAVTGHFYPDFKVGSSDEDLFFKVCLSGYLPETSYGKFLYYSSPSEYEYHFHANVSGEIFERKITSLSNETSTPTYVR